MLIGASTAMAGTDQIQSLAPCDWWARQELNLRPNGYEPSALTTELRAHFC